MTAMPTILIADDNEHNLQLLQLLLQGQGYQVLSASNGLEALVAARRTPPDLIVSDVLMPGMDGFTLCRECRLDPVLNHTPFVFYTAEYTDGQARELAARLGVTRFIVKPAAPEQLLAELAAALADRPPPSRPEDSTYLRDYQDALIRKLEEKMVQTEAANRQLLGLQQASTAMSSSLGLDEVLQQIARGAVTALDCNAVWILVTSEPPGTLLSRVLLGVRDGHILALEDALGLKTGGVRPLPPPDADWLHDILLNGAPAVIACPTPATAAGLPTTLQTLGRLIDFQSLALIPMIAKQQSAVGLMALARSSPDGIADAELQLLTAFARQAASAIDNARLFAKVEQSERRYRTLLEHSADAIVALDDALTVTDWSSGAARIFGYTPEDMLGRPLTPLFPDPLRATFSTRAARVRRHGNLRGWRTRLLRRDGRLIDVELTLIDLGPEQGFTIVLTDISERLEKEAQLLHAQKLDALGQLVGGIAHDFNNLLTIILGNLRFLCEAVGQNADDDTSELLEDALSAGLDGAQLTQRLLGFSRRQALTARRVELNSVIGDFLRLLKRTLSTDIELVFTPAAEPLAVRVDPSQLESALLNLCLNARDALPAGGRLTIGTARHHSANRTEPATGDWIALTVTDNGSGIAPELLDRVCEPFFTTKEAGKGSGLGLSMVYGFVQQSKGELSIQSEPGQGTTVTLLLPETTATDSDETRASSDPLLSGQETILVVEDEERVRRYAQRCLSALGYRVLTSAHAAAAIGRLQREPAIDLLFSDIAMPGTMNGRGLALWAAEHRPEVKTLLTTSHPERANADEEPLFPVLYKPYSKAELAAQVRRVLDGE